MQRDVEPVASATIVTTLFQWLDGLRAILKSIEAEVPKQRVSPVG